MTNTLEIIIEKTKEWLNTGIELIPNLIAATIVLLVFFVIGWIIRRIISNSLNKFMHNKVTVKLIVTFIGFIIVSIGFFIALAFLHLDGVVTSLLAGAGVLGIVLGFAFQDIAGNFMSGIVLSIRHPFNIGDLIESNNYFGEVHEVNLRETIIKSMEGQLVYIPNKVLFNNTFENYTWNNQRRIDLDCRVSYHSDLEKVKTLAIEVVQESVVNLIEGKEIQVVYKEFGDSSINFEIRFWVHFTRNFDFMDGRSEAIMAIKKKFEENNIDIPWPVRTLEFSTEGGELLRDILADGSDELNGSRETES